jgi:hypothetical protein
MALARRWVRALDGGPLAYSRYCEDLTALILAMNRRYKAHASIKLTASSRTLTAFRACRGQENCGAACKTQRAHSLRNAEIHPVTNSGDDLRRADRRSPLGGRRRVVVAQKAVSKAEGASCGS